VVTAPGSPGAASYYDEARKDCVGTSATTASKVWFTVADGQLSDVYEPTIDNTNVKSMEWVVTNGSSWTDIQSRDMTYTVSADPSGMSCTVTAGNATHGYTLSTTYFTDPSADAVIAHTVFKGPSGLQAYARLQPLVNGDGGGGTVNAGGNSAQVYTSGDGPVAAAWSTNRVTDATNRAYAVPTYEVLAEAGGLGQASAGYAGTGGDGATGLAATHRLPDYNSAPDGDVVLTAQVRFGQSDSANLALGFGRTLLAAVGVAQAAADASPTIMLAAYLAGWHSYDASLNRPSPSLTPAQQVEYYRAINVVKASEDKTFSGAIVAGLASPWGQAVPAGVDGAYDLPTYFGSYREVFARDLYEAFTALLVAGDLKTARAAALFLFDRQQQADGSMPRNSLLNGKAAPDTGGLQLDETSYPVLMAWQSGLAGDHQLYVDHVRPAADFLVTNGPSEGVERWEEQSGYSPSTIAAEIAGLTAASAIATRNGDMDRARLYQATADHFARNVKNWTVTTIANSSYSTKPYFVRIAPDGNPNDKATLNLGNGGPSGVPEQQVIDAGFLELVRLGVLPATDPTIENSLTVVDKTIEVQTPSGPGFYRYGTLGSIGSAKAKGGDGYGDCYQPSLTTCSTTGAPWAATGTGTGHPWPVLNGERGEYDVAAGQVSQARTMLQTMLNMGSGDGIEPEQVWEHRALPASPYGTDPTTGSIGFVPGSPDGSASPLTWAEAQYVRLASDIGAGKLTEQPSIVADRYVVSGMPGSLPLTITSPAPSTITSATTVTIRGTTAPGATVDVEGWDQLRPGSTWARTVTASSSGAWSVAVAIGPAITTITATATAGQGGRSTGYAQTSVVSTASA
jgi:glucoamylase